MILGTVTAVPADVG